MKDKKIIYILGCGRSGSTILGFCIGNTDDALDLGEILDFARYSGCPNGFDSSTENYGFWDGVIKRIEASYGVLDFDKILKIQRRFDSHYSFPLLFLIGKVLLPFGLRKYRELLRLEYDSIFCQSQHCWYVDGSKYPSRLLHLKAIYGGDAIRVIHLIRDPGSLANAFKNSGQSKTKSFMGSIMYFLSINCCSILVYLCIPSTNRIRLIYEDLIQSPERNLEIIGKKFQLKVDNLVSKIETGQPLKRGFIFNGNRMRMQETVVFRKSKPTPEVLLPHQKVLSSVLKFIFRF